MKFLLDTGNIKQISKYKDYIEGVTTNPIILGRENKSIESFYEEAKNIVQRVFVQIQSEEDVFSNKPRVIYKVPLIPKLFPLLKKLKDKGLQVCGTTTYDVFQFHRACDLGCQYCIVLCHKNVDKAFLFKCNNIKFKYNYETKIIAASFREKNEVEEAILIGADYITVRPETLEECLINDHANKDVEEYNEHSSSNTS
jgi:transaldolase